jgi:lipopolysaccharide assembly outer membrane protein LptD (OstA)
MIQFNKGKINAIRHVITPNLSFSYKPDFSDEKFGYYRNVQLENGNNQEYSIMQNGIFGSPSTGKQGNISLNFSNILEAKINTKNDTLNSTKKIKILESLNIGSSYNIFADSLNLNDINLNARTRFLDLIDFNFSSRYDPYITNTNQNNNLNQLELNKNGRLARFTNANATLGLNISNNSFKKKKQDSKAKIQWNLNANYSINYNKGYRSSTYADTIQSLNFSGDIKITDKWKLNFRSGYDFDTKKLTYSSINIYRDLHCWEMMLNLIPIGYHKSYTFTIRVKASVLQDLKLERKRDWIDTDFN